MARLSGWLKTFPPDPARFAHAHPVRKKIRIEGTFLRSAVGRRVFLLFVLSAFVPVVILAVLSYRQVYQVVSESAQRQLVQVASAHNRFIYDRLLGASFILSADASQIRHTQAGDTQTQANLQGVFRRLYRVVDGNASVRWGLPQVETVPQMDALAAAHLAKGGVALLQTRPPGAAPSLWLAMALDPAQPTHDVLVAELDPEYVWGDDEELSYQTQVCVLAADRVPLDCSDGALGALAAAAMPNGSQGKPTVTGGWQVASSGLFLKARFAAPEWTTVALRPDDLMATSFSRMGQTLWGILALTLLLVALLSVTQIRRTLGPLERLIEGTKRIAREDFDHPVRIWRNDEFGQLAGAFNNMANRLKQQLVAMRALSEIDQLILSHLDVGQIVERVQRRVLEVLPQVVVGVIVPDDMSAEWATVYLRRKEDAQSSQIREPMGQLCLADFLNKRDGTWLRIDDPALPNAMGMLGGVGMAHVFVWPIIAHDEVVGLLAIGINAQPDQYPGIHAQIRDLGSRIGVALAAHAHEKQLVFLAHHDGLTGLPNRLFLSERLQQELAYARRHHTKLALLFIDLDRFKNINDSHGHEVGDQLLCQVAQRLTSQVRDCDTVARLGGDEFVILQTGVQAPKHAAKLAETLLQALAQSFQMADTANFIGGSIGIAMFPDDGQSAEDLLKHADIAMYRAKAAGRGRMVFFEDSMNQELCERSLLEQELHQAIDRNQLSVHYQPRIRLKDGRLIGAEALLRWQHPELGWVSPARFIPLAEDSGLIDQIGLWVLRQVCSQLALWQSAGYAIGSVSVNVSGRQFRATKLVEQVRDALAASGLAPELLELEVTEGVLIDDIEFVAEILDQLKQTGVSLALDDFGTGYSSMAYLKRLPIDVLKIDQSFVRDLEQDQGSRSIVQAIIALAHALNKSVVAEGVETQPQADLLLAWGCEEVQGYHFGRPMTAQALEQVMRVAV